MKKKTSITYGLLAILMFVAGLVVPGRLGSPIPVVADPGVCKWDTLREPGGLTGLEAILNCSEGIDLAIGSDFATVYAIVKEPLVPYSYMNVLKQSTVKGLLWSGGRWSALTRETSWTTGDEVFQIAIAPDNPNFIAVTATYGGPTKINLGPRELWVSQNGGSDWDFTSLNTALLTSETIRAIDISVDYGGKRDIAVATTTGTGGGRLLVVKSTGFSGWLDQKVTTITNTDTSILLGAVDFFAVKFSPSYASDASLAVVYADKATADNTICLLSDPNIGATFYNVAHRDLDADTTLDWSFAKGIEVKDPTWVVGASPSLSTLNKVDLELPSDFSGQAASLRRAYISTDAMAFTTTTCTFGTKSPCNRDGIFRIDDTTVYTLMDTSQTPDKSIYSIAYFGTYASGKLLAGERMGYPCTATVPTWFTDSPTTCPVPCWYPCLKCPTGAACPPSPCACTVSSKQGVGAAIVAWAPQGNLAYALTSSAAVVTGASWFSNLYYLPALLGTGLPYGVAPVCNDESALSISRNNGETWNQVSFIDTVISKFTDIAPSPDCKTVYLASVSSCLPTTGCSVSISANFTCTGASGGSCNITYSVPTVDSCGNPIKAGTFGLTWTCSYDPATCTCSFSAITMTGKVHCACSTCDNCTVDFGATSVLLGTTVQTQPIQVQTTNGTATWKVFTIKAPIDCSTQPGCTSIKTGCCCFDSVWRSSLSPDVESPLSPAPVGTIWERVFTHVTAPDCTFAQTDQAILRLVPYCADPTGEIIAWAVYDPASTFKHGVAAWSPDFGDYWAMLTPRNPIQDFTFESRTVMYFLSPSGLVQKMPYTGTAWSSSLANVDSGMSYGAHTIAAYPEGKVVVGASAVTNAVYYSTSYSGDFNTDNPTFNVQIMSGSTGGGNVHIAFDPNFKDNSMIYIGVDGTSGSVFRNNPGAQLTWGGTDMMDASNGAVGCNAPHAVGQYGIVLPFTGQALYSAHQSSGTAIPCGVDRTIDDGTGKFGPLSGIPKPGIAWDHLSAGFPATAPCFTLEPSSLKICGCCSLDTDSTLYAIDNSPNGYVPGVSGLIWGFTDCLAKRGPALVTADKALIGCDPVSGRAGEVNLCWEQLCVASAYDIEIAKDAAFTIRVLDWVNEGCGGLAPADVTAPCVFFPAGGFAEAWNSAVGLAGNLECGHTYYWRIKARACATTQYIRSPWSEVRSFNVKAGLPVVGSYTGLQLLSPANGSMGIVPVKSPSFSWAPLGENTKYKFQLAKDGNMTQIVKEAEVTNTAYMYDGTLDYSTPYFWKVSCVDPACDSSATFSFVTEPKPAAAEEKAPVAPTPLWVWVVIAIFAILVILILILTFMTHRK